MQQPPVELSAALEDDQETVFVPVRGRLACVRGEA